MLNQQFQEPFVAVVVRGVVIIFSFHAKCFVWCVFQIHTIKMIFRKGGFVPSKHDNKHIFRWNLRWDWDWWCMCCSFLCFTNEYLTFLTIYAIYTSAGVPQASHNLVCICSKLTGIVKDSWWPDLRGPWRFVWPCLFCCSTVSCFPQIDPTRTISAGKVNLGAFRTYPKVNYI